MPQDVTIPTKAPPMTDNAAPLMNPSVADTLNQHCSCCTLNPVLLRDELERRAGVPVAKFKFNRQQYLMAYWFATPQTQIQRGKR